MALDYECPRVGNSLKLSWHRKYLFRPPQKIRKGECLVLSSGIIEQYFQALQARDGSLAASLFAEDGVIDDFRGRHHAGREAIAAFIGQVPTLELEFPCAPVTHARRVAVYGNILYPGQAPVLVRWVFTAENGLIGHLCNSRIELIPESFRNQKPLEVKQ